MTTGMRALRLARSPGVLTLRMHLQTIAHMDHVHLQRICVQNVLLDDVHELDKECLVFGVDVQVTEGVCAHLRLLSGG
jgi:hypothetical protein